MNGKSIFSRKRKDHTSLLSLKFLHLFSHHCRLGAFTRMQTQSHGLLSRKKRANNTCGTFIDHNSCPAGSGTRC